MLWHGILSARVSGVLVHGSIMVKHKENSLWASEKLIRVFFHPAVVFIWSRRIFVEYHVGSELRGKLIEIWNQNVHIWFSQKHSPPPDILRKLWE